MTNRLRQSTSKNLYFPVVDIKEWDWSDPSDTDEFKRIKQEHFCYLDDFMFSELSNSDSHYDIITD